MSVGAIERIDCRTVDKIERDKHYSHPNAKDIGSCAEGCCDRYLCPDCGTRFTVEASQ